MLRFFKELFCFHRWTYEYWQGLTVEEYYRDCPKCEKHEVVMRLEVE